jgi:hypothetical protein
MRPKQGGVLKMYSPDSPEATVFAEGPMMGVFNNLVMYDQHVPQSSLQSIVPDLAIGCLSVQNSEPRDDGALMLGAQGTREAPTSERPLSNFGCLCRGGDLVITVGAQVV